jgi:Megaviricetes DNA primase
VERLDATNMLVFTNGVMDLDKFEFREGRPDDLLSVQLPFVYQPQDAQSAECAYVMEFMATIQPDPDTRDYLLTVLSLCLSTDTSMQYFWIFTGAGANGKSKLMNLLSDTLGGHFGAAPAALLTRRREDANQANEALSGLQKSRVAVFSEGSSSEIIQVNTVKLFTGEDAISTRGLHEKQQRWKPFFKCILVCNDIPKLDDNSWAGWRRFRVVSFTVQFVDNPVRSHERKKDPEVGRRLAECTGAFAGILVEYFRRFKERGLKESEQVVKATQAYQTDNDLMEEFRQEKLIEDQHAALQATTAYEAFEAWARKKRRRIPDSRKAVQAMFEGKFGETKTVRGSNYDKGVRGWKGYLLASEVF